MTDGPERTVLHFYPALYLPSGNAYRWLHPPLPSYWAVECVKPMCSMSVVLQLTAYMLTTTQEGG
jgi:hypothetical protein